MVALLIRPPRCPDIDLSGTRFDLHDCFGKLFFCRVQVQRGDPDIRRSRNYRDWFICRECRPDYRHVLYYQNHALYRIATGHYLDVLERRYGAIGLGSVAGYLYGCADPKTTDVDEEGDCAVSA